MGVFARVLILENWETLSTERHGLCLYGGFGERGVGWGDFNLYDRVAFGPRQLALKDGNWDGGISLGAIQEPCGQAR